MAVASSLTSKVIVLLPSKASGRPVIHHGGGVRYELNIVGPIAVGRVRSDGELLVECASGGPQEDLGYVTGDLLMWYRSKRTCPASAPRQSRVVEPQLR